MHLHAWARHLWCQNVWLLVICAHHPWCWRSATRLMWSCGFSGTRSLLNWRDNLLLHVLRMDHLHCTLRGTSVGLVLRGCLKQITRPRQHCGHRSGLALAIPTPEDREATKRDGWQYHCSNYLDKICAIITSHHIDARIIILLNDMYDCLTLKHQGWSAWLTGSQTFWHPKCLPQPWRCIPMRR